MSNQIEVFEGEQEVVVSVEGCWSGHKFYHRLEFLPPHRSSSVREFISGCDWTEESEEDALSLLYNNYRILPRLVRFEVR